MKQILTYLGCIPLVLFIGILILIDMNIHSRFKTPIPTQNYSYVYFLRENLISYYIFLQYLASKLLKNVLKNLEAME